MEIHTVPFYQIVGIFSCSAALLSEAQGKGCMFYIKKFLKFAPLRQAEG